MSPVEFTAACELGGYCDGKTAGKYITGHPKPDYTCDDVIAAYRLGAGREPVQIHGRRIGNGYYSDGERSQGYTTKRYESVSLN